MSLAPFDDDTLGDPFGDPFAPVESEPERGRMIRLVPASSIEPIAASWLMHHRIPLGGLSLLAGREGLGKSSLAAAWIADVTHGRMDGAIREPRAVLIDAREDDKARTIVPRLQAAGADLDRVHFVDVLDGGMQTGISLPYDTARLRQAIRDKGAALVVLDPLVSALGDRLDSHKDHSVRQGLDPINQVASETGAAILGLVHLNKSSGTDALDRVSGSRAFTAAARAVILMTPDDEDDTGRQRLVIQTKSNLGPLDLDALVVAIEARSVMTSTGPTEVGAVVMRGTRHVDRDAALAPPDDDAKDAAAWLREHLIQNGGEDFREDVVKAAQGEFSVDQLKRARKRAGVESFRESTKSPRSIWRLRSEAL